MTFSESNSINPRLFNPFQREPFLSCWQEHLASKFDIVHQQGDWLVNQKPIIGNALGQIFKLREVRIAGWNAAWYQHFDAKQQDDLKALLTSQPWGLVRWDWTESFQSKTELQAIRTFAAKHRYKYLEYRTAPSYLIDLSQGYEHYFKEKSRSNRKSVKKRFDAAQKASLKLKLTTDVDYNDLILEEFIAAHLRRWKTGDSESYLHEKQEQIFLKQLTKALSDSGYLRLDRLWINSTVSNYSITITNGVEEYFLMTVNTQDYQEFSPGVLAKYLRVENAAERGVKVIDMGSVANPAKVQASNRQEACNISLLVNPNSLFGNISAWGLHRFLSKQ